MTELTRLCALDDIDPEAGLRVDVGELRIALVRIDDDVYAIGDRCSHADVSLADGEVDVDDCAIECPKHGSLFSLTTGEPLSMPAVRPVPVYSIEVVGPDVMLRPAAADQAPDVPAQESS
ncbi:MAG: non-heme iron oxygenase ferredoxin subunit [Acidimicrobiales bacterium]|nr:non-heme iron oxygenase ferredoxin subunit [Acidimicrobiales bacterium]